MVEGSLDSFSISESLSSIVGERAIPVSGFADVEQRMGLVRSLYRPIKGSNKRQKDMHNR